MPTLTEELAAMRLAAFGDATKPGRIPAETAAVMRRVTADQRDSGYRDRMPLVGDAMPGFSLADSDGTVVESAALLARGPVMMSFFRGA